MKAPKKVTPLEVPTVACRGCGKPIVWIELDGKKIPLDPRAPVYRVWPADDGGLRTPQTGERAPQKSTETYLAPLYMVSHFATCPKASDFSRRNG